MLGGLQSSDATWAEVMVLQDRVRACRADRAASIVAYEVLIAHPCCHHHDDLGGNWMELAALYAAEQRFDDAIAAQYSAIEAGLQASPDPRADIAEYLLAAGRRDEGDALYTELHDAAPDDVWLYNSAAFAYQRVDDREALRWALAGIDLAMRTGDPEQLVAQLLDTAVVLWDRLGEAHDETLTATVDQFVADSKRPPPWTPRSYSSQPVPPRACTCCDYDPDQPPPPLPVRRERWQQGRVVDRAALPQLSRAKTGPLAVAWFTPTPEWEAACARWPDLVELGSDYQQYCRCIEASLKRLSANLPGQRLCIATLTLNDITNDADDGEQSAAGLRAGAAAEAARTGRSIPWPSGRNTSCWCGSTRKYKQCCGPTPSAPQHD